MVIEHDAHWAVSQYGLMAEKFQETRDFKELNRQEAIFGDAYWANDKRRNYQADVWYNRNRNDICMGLLGDRAKGKRVLSIGGGQWVEREFLNFIGALETVITDLIPSEGVMEVDAQRMPFPPESFDIVVARDMIEHVEDADRVYAEIKRVLCPEGLLLITTPNGFHQQIDGVIHQRAYTPESFLNELGEQGFNIVKKAGNVPYILTALLPIAEEGLPFVLDEFKRTARKTEGYEYLYFIGTQLFVLCRKRREA